MLSDPFTVKVAALLLLAAVRLLAGLTPIMFASSLRTWGEQRVEACSSLALCFGGGVLLSSCMLHMIPEVRESLSVLELKTEFPVPEFIVCCGFFLVYIVEEIVLSFTKPSGLRSFEAELRISGKVTPLSDVKLKGFGLTKRESQGTSRHFLVLTALFLHSALEGLALGLQPNARSVWMLFVAITAHAVTVLFSIGLDLVTAHTPELQIIVFMGVLALSSPLGGCIGMLATSQGEKAHAGAVVTLQGLAAGAVLFVVFFEVLDKEKKKGGFLRLACIFLGFAAMASFQLLGEYSLSLRLYPSTFFIWSEISSPTLLISKINSSFRMF